MKTIKKTILLCLSLLFIYSCNSDDDDNSNDEPDNTNELIQALIMDVTGGSETIWKIDTALLTNSNVTDLDVSDAFNIVDDEFIFKAEANSQAITLEYRQGNSFNENASDASEFLLDYYRSTENSSLTITDLENKIFSGANKTFTFSSNESISANLVLQGGTLSVDLSPKTYSDFAMPPSGGLNFTEAFIYESNNVSSHAPGMIGSYSDNSFFIVNREDDLNTGNGAPERIVKYNLNNNTSQENLYFEADFVSKQLHIQNNQLIALGGQNVNTYSLSLTGNPTTHIHGKALSRHGVAVIENDMYIIGGDLDNIESDKIFKWNLSNQTLSEVATMPAPRSGARGTIVNNKLYIFGGTEEFAGEIAFNSVYVYNLLTNSFENTLTMPKDINFTFVDRYQNLIYIAGRIDSNNNRDLFLGVLNTEDNTIQEITSNLDDSDEFSTIHAMCVFNNKMYVLYGGLGVDNGGQFLNWSIMTADL